MAPMSAANGPPSIICPRCGRRSYNRNDIGDGYCGACHDWTSPECLLCEGTGVVTVAGRRFGHPCPFGHPAGPSGRAQDAVW